MEIRVVNDHEIAADGRTLWVNGPHGLCVARFSARAGYEIDKDNRRETQSGPCKPEDWTHFAQRIKDLFEVALPEDMRPEPYKT